MNVFLIGYRGSGKTTVARILAERLQMRWIDADEHLERIAGKSIKDIFVDDGEQAFRDLESQVVAELAARRDTVLALGGGAVVRQENRDALAGAGIVVWLKASKESLFERIGTDPVTAKRRPDLTASGGYDEIERLLSEREPIYRACADLVVDTEGRTPEQVADDVLAQLKSS